MSMKPEDIYESIKLEKLLENIVKEIFDDYNLSTDKGIKAALRQAAWVGMCKAKGWD